MNFAVSNMDDTMRRRYIEQGLGEGALEVAHDRDQVPVIGHAGDQDRDAALQVGKRCSQWAPKRIRDFCRTGAFVDRVKAEQVPSCARPLRHAFREPFAASHNAWRRRWTCLLL